MENQSPQYALIAGASHPIQEQAFIDTHWRWHSLKRLNINLPQKYEGGLLLVPNLPEIVYKNARGLANLSYHWLYMDDKYKPERLSEVAQKAGIVLHFFQYPFQTKYWSREFLDEAARAINLQQTS